MLELVRRLVATLVVLTANAVAQDLPPDSPVLRTSTRLVQLNVIVQDKNGPIRGLTKDDFSITDQGKPKAISIFSMESNNTAPMPAPPSAPDTFTNKATLSGSAPGGVVVVLLDGMNTRFEDQARSKRHLIEFLKGADPRTRIAVYALGEKLSVLCDFTDPAQLQKLLSKYRGVADDVATSEPTRTDIGDDILNAFLNESNQVYAGMTDAHRAAATMAAFVSIANHLAQIPGRKSLIWVTGGTPFSVSGLAKGFNNGEIAVYPVDARGLVGMPASLLAANQNATRHNMHSVIPNFSPGGLGGLQDIADETGGRAFYNSNDVNNCIRMAVEDAAVSYTLGFYVDSDALDGRYHDLKVKVNRSGAIVRYRKGYYAFKDIRASNRQNQNNLLAALRSPLESSSITLLARVSRVDEPKAHSLKVTCSVDIHNLELAQKNLQWTGAIEVFVVQQNRSGKVLDTLRETFDLHFTKEIYEGYLKSGMTFEELIEPQPGLATLRVLIADRSNAAVGSLIVPLSEVK